MKKTRLVAFAVLLMLVLVTPAIAGDNRDEARDLNLMARYTWDRISAETQLTTMNAVIDYADENGIAASDLKEIRDGFSANLVDLRSAAESGDGPNYWSIRREMFEQAREFRQVYFANNEFRGHGPRVRIAINDALAARLDEFDGMWDDAKGGILEYFDWFVETGNEIIERLDEAGADTSELEGILDEFKSKRDDLEEAYDNRDGTEVAEIVRELHVLVIEFREETSIARIHIITEVRAPNIIANMEMAIDRIEDLGGDTNELERHRASFEEHIDAAEDYADDGRIGAAWDEIRAARGDLSDFVEVFRSHVRFHGTGRLVAEGDGYASMSGRGTISITADEGVLTVVDEKGEASVTVSGEGNKTDYGNGTVVYKGFDGKATIRGEEISVTIEGTGITLDATGTGTVLLKGEGTYKVLQGTDVRAEEAWTEDGISAEYGGE